MASSQIRAAKSRQAFFAFGLIFSAPKGVQGIYRVIYRVLFLDIVSC
jgi:hypothetical protein